MTTELTFCEVCGCTAEDTELSCAVPDETHCLASILSSARHGDRLDEVLDGTPGGDPDQEIALLRADRHKYGAGKVHAFDGSTGKTQCGRTREQCPGRIDVGYVDSVTCLLCVRSLEAARQREQQQREWAEREAQWDRERADRRARYSAYLLTPGLRARRAKVLHRAGGKCEGCLERPATQVHHLTYEHVGDELLFELVAICDVCHSKIHGGWS